MMATVTTTQDPAIPDLRDVPPGVLASAPSGLAAAIALYRERTEQDTPPAGGFNSSI